MSRAKPDSNPDAPLPRVLGPQGLHIVKEAASKLEDIDRTVLQQKIEAASQRPSPGTSNLLGGRDYPTPHYWNGSHDLTGVEGLLPVHLPKDRYNGR